MNRLKSIRQRALSLFARMMAAPIFVKVLGISSLVAILFGGATLLQTRASMSRILYHSLEQRARSSAHSLAEELERPVTTADLFSVMQRITALRGDIPDLRYVVVRDPNGRLLASTFQKAVPADLQRRFAQSAAGRPDLKVLAGEEGNIFDVVCPILNGDAGTVQLGLLDRAMSRELSSLTRSVLWDLVFCLAIGAGLAFALRYILTHPIRGLIRTANTIREGDFAARADVFWADEIGRLAVAFNQMAEGLQNYRREVQEKERARVALIERIVHVQEEERKSISRELHDQVGQSLTAVLLSLHAGCEYSKWCTKPCRNIEAPVRELIEEVRRLAWGMRPSILDDFGLDSALARHIDDTSRRSHLEMDYQYSGPSQPRRLPNRVEVTLFRVAQEAITNILRHAQATRASVVVLQQDNDITLLVEDNGRGFDVASAQDGNGTSLGLKGMKERVALLGGTCAVESVPGKGTTIRVKIPLKEEHKCLSVS